MIRIYEVRKHGSAICVHVCDHDIAARKFCDTHKQCIAFDDKAGFHNSMGWFYKICRQPYWDNTTLRRQRKQAVCSSVRRWYELPPIEGLCR